MINGARGDGDDDGAREKGIKVKKTPPPLLGLHKTTESGGDGGVGVGVDGRDADARGAGRPRASVPMSEDGMRNWVIELDPNSPTTTVGGTVSRPHSYVRGW
jgi:hypothetical protein